MFEPRDILMLIYSGMALVLVLAWLSHLRKMALINAGLYKPHRSHGSADWQRVRNGLAVLLTGGVVALGIYHDLDGWLIFWLIVAGLGLSKVVGGLVRR